MGTVTVDGVVLHYSRLGTEGPDVVLVHGLGANRAFWFWRIAHTLARGHVVTIYDMRGHGRSDVPPSGYTSATMAGDLKALLDHLGVGRAHLVGHSFGGAVVLHFAVLHPDRVATLVLADARVPAFETNQRLADWAYWPVWRSRLRAAGMPVPDGDREIDATLLREWAHPRWRRARETLAGRHGFAPFAGWRDDGRARLALDRLLDGTTAGDDARAVAGLTADRIDEVRRPVLALYGQHSYCLATLRGLRRTLPDCTSHIVPGAGHYHPVVRPELFVRHVRAFVEEHS